MITGKQKPRKPQSSAESTKAAVQPSEAHNYHKYRVSKQYRCSYLLLIALWNGLNFRAKIGASLYSRRFVTSVLEMWQPRSFDSIHSEYCDQFLPSCKPITDRNREIHTPLITVHTVIRHVDTVNTCPVAGSLFPSLLVWTQGRWMSLLVSRSAADSEMHGMKNVLRSRLVRWL